MNEERRIDPTWNMARCEAELRASQAREAKLRAQVAVLAAAKSCSRCNNTGEYEVDCDGAHNYYERCECADSKEFLLGIKRNPQAAADQFIAECEQRGAVKALEELAFKMRDANAGELSAFMEVIDFIHIVEAEAAELRATSKKSGC